MKASSESSLWNAAIIIVISIVLNAGVTLPLRLLECIHAAAQNVSVHGRCSDTSIFLNVTVGLM